MASTYALPVTAMHHSHMHAHSYGGHSPSRSLSPSKLGPNARIATNSLNSLRPERSNGTLNSHDNGAAHHEHDDYLPHIHTHNPHPAARSPLHTAPINSLPGPWDICPPEASSETHAGDAEVPDHPENGQYHNHYHEAHDHDHCGHTNAQSESRSRFSDLLLRHTEGIPLLQSIILEKDSRRIFYFMTLNFAFMMVQAVYGFLTDSLGLLSDSIHMLFDCIALALGLFAAVSSKWPPSERFPYGFGKIESLSGFGNGVFLMLISIEIIIEATERLAEGHKTKRLGELFVVSSLGLIVNLVGMACFGHHHHGHDHSHEHIHSHDDSHDKKHDHDVHDSHKQPTPSPMTISAVPHTHSHNSHSHENENMRGIFLHVLADTMGSAAVIVSTILIHFLGWPGWDPLASCIIAVLIFLSSLPLVSSCARRLLLTVPDDTEYQLRDTLAGVSSLRGVASYSVPRFWMSDQVSERREEKVLGVMHIVATRGSDRDDVRERARAFLSSHGMDVVIQVDREGEGKCWCGGDSSRSPSTSVYS